MSKFLFLFLGFGFTLKGKSDFTLRKFLAGKSETFDPYYGVNGINGDGDIFKSENIHALQNYVNKCTKQNGIHIVMADGVSLIKQTGKQKRKRIESLSCSSI